MSEKFERIERRLARIVNGRHKKKCMFEIPCSKTFVVEYTESGDQQKDWEYILSELHKRHKGQVFYWTFSYCDKRISNRYHKLALKMWKETNK